MGITVSGEFPFLLEESSFLGVKKITEKVSEDVYKVIGATPRIDIDKVAYNEAFGIIVGTIGHSANIQKLIDEGRIDASLVIGRREVFGIYLLEQPFGNLEKSLVICGSDKLGTIYGLFEFSEYIGVSPMCYFGDVEPLKQGCLEIREDIVKISKEPSVKYRGFFINDEWPCFGNWTFSHFDGFTAKMYDKVFEFLLRMKGNYLWPAMWSSSFPLDGPGELSEELADMYGITIAYSHHEPCLRASEEWDIVRGEDSVYGNEWNYYTNSKGLTRYWKDALVRSGKYNHMITIGMRGERDSSMLGEDATLRDNIELLKNIITTQRNLIRECVNSNLEEVPQLLALYKEVEAYFYGDEQTEGLCKWDELDDVIFMLCEDNFGHMRTLPTEQMRKHEGGYGMYFHLDYHGSPISYEWMPSTTFETIWEQMTQAYDYGIKDVWIVNVGDLKGNEVALNYFLSLAYDFERWGTSAINSCDEYMMQWTKKNFPGMNDEDHCKIAKVYRDFVKMNAKRRPEALHAGIYHPCNYNETDNMLEMAEGIEKINEEVYSKMNEQQRLAYFSMIYYPAKTSINLLRMHLYAGKNEHYARQGRKIANQYAELVTECIKNDRELTQAFGNFRDGKWKGMELEEHIGFTKWNDDGYKYPLRMMVEPVSKPRLSVSRQDSQEIYVKNYGTPMKILVHDFLFEGNEKVSIELSNDGVGELEYNIKNADDLSLPIWLTVNADSGKVDNLKVVDLICDRSKLPSEIETVTLIVSDGDTNVAIEVKAVSVDKNNIPKGTFLPNNDTIVMDADQFIDNEGVQKGGFVVLDNYGRSGVGLKIMPSTATFDCFEDKPKVTYQFLSEKADEYIVEVWTTPTNSLQIGEPLRMVVGNANEEKIITILDENYKGGDSNDVMWSTGVLDQIRVSKAEFLFEKGVQQIYVEPLEAGLIIEKLIIYPKGKCLKKSYLGPKESIRI